ncbi:MAG: aldolase catalytic domain-containing protein [Lachnospiraceae bacterium]|nr:aldolase catalytic domain-containing protein [Lachnospiraceae bacterium]
MSRGIGLLDCTLRDGGYINEWNWGRDIAKDIISYGVKAGVDVIEVGFLRNAVVHDDSITVASRIEDLNELLPENTTNTMFAAMVMCSNYDINRLSSYSGKGIEMIRVTAHDYDLVKGMEFVKKIKKKGYKVSFNPINIMGYSDEELLFIAKKINEMIPYQFTIVDTFGSMRMKDMRRIVTLFDHNICKDVKLAIHLHENMSLSTSLAQEFISMHLNRMVSIDASLMGIGRAPGNLPIEVIADYLNDNEGTDYNTNFFLDAIDNYISPLKGDAKWGYSTAYFLSAKFNLHRNYSEYYLKKGNLACSDLCRIFEKFDHLKATVFDEDYAEQQYISYLRAQRVGSGSYDKLKSILQDKKIVIIAPGKSITEYKKNIIEELERTDIISLSVNFIPEDISVSYAFFSNNKRLELYKSECGPKIIVTSNIVVNDVDYKVDYFDLIKETDNDYNGLLLLLCLLDKMNICSVVLMGADGYSDEDSYYKKNIKTSIKRDELYNQKVGSFIKNLNMKVKFFTPSLYEKYAK